MSQSMHDVSDPRNESILINVNGELKPRAEAVVSVFDSRLHARRRGVGRPARTQGEDRLPRPPSRPAVRGRQSHRDGHRPVARGSDSEALRNARCQRHGGGRARAADGHPRHSLDALSGPASGRFAGATIVIIPEYKEPRPGVYERGLKLFTVHVRRGDPAVQDQKINSHSKLNCILASIQATQAGADEALMLDPHGFVATCNSTHFFIVRKGEVWTSSGKYCLGGITRGVGAGDCARGRDSGDRKGFLADRRLWRRRSLRHRHVRRNRSGARGGRPPAQVPRANGRGLQQLYAERIERDVAEQRRP